MHPWHRQGCNPTARSYVWMFGLAWLGFGFSYSDCILFTQPAASPSPSSIYEYIIMFKIHKTHRYTYKYGHIPQVRLRGLPAHTHSVYGEGSSYVYEWMNEWCGVFVNASLKLFFLQFNLPTDFWSHENIMVYLIRK